MISRTLRRGRALAALAVGALVASTSIVGFALPASAADDEGAKPSITVSKTSGLSGGDEVSVSGSGYDPAVPLYLIVCSDVELSEVDFAFASGCTDGAVLITNTPTRPTQVKLEDDGTFIASIAVKEFEGGAAIYTLADSTLR